MSEEKVIATDEYSSEQIDVDDISNKYLTFELSAVLESSKVFGIAMKNIIEIITIQQISEVPHAPSYVKGLVNLRGSLVPLVDINERFGFPETEYNDRTCVIVVEIKENLIGLIVNQVYDVVTIRKTSPLPAEIDQISNKYVSGVAELEDGRVALIMDAALVVDAEAMDMV